MMATIEEHLIAGDQRTLKRFRWMTLTLRVQDLTEVFKQAQLASRGAAIAIEKLGRALRMAGTKKRRGWRRRGWK